MKISVVTVCRNSAKTIRDTIGSLVRQTHMDREFLVIDGASTDDTLAAVKSMASSDVRIVSEPDRGIYDAMNKGLRLFAGDAVGFLNSDDTYHDDQVLARIAEALESADIVFGDVNMVVDHEHKTLVREWRAGGYGRWSYQLGWMPPHSTFYARRNVIEKIGEFNLKYKITADYDLMLRAMALNEFRICYIPKVFVDFKMGGLSTRGWKETVRVNMECLQSRRENLHAPVVDLAFFLRPLRRVFQVRRIGRYLFRRI